MYNLHSFSPNIQFNFAFHLVLFHKYNRFRTQHYNQIEKHGLKKEYETLPYPYDKTVHFCPLESKKQKEVIDKLSKIIFEIKDSIEITGGYPSNYIDDLLKILEDKEVSE